jgi:hypothetical protein
MAPVMGERLIKIHLIESGSHGRDALFEVALVLGDDERALLRAGDHEQWRFTVGRAQRMIRDHVAHRLESDERV